MKHEELQDLLPAYALDALEPSEEMELRAHLATCGSCRSSLAPLAETAGALALLAAPATPPPRLREEIMAETARPGEPAPFAQPTPLRRRPIWPRLAAGVAAAAVLVLAAFNIRLAGRLNEQERQLAEQRRLVQVLASSSSSIPLVAAAEGSQASGMVYLAPNSKAAGIVMAGLPDPGDGVYQLWLLEDGRPIPLDAFRPDSRGAAVVYVQGDMEGMDAMAVTLEDDPSLPAPEGPAVLRS